jgi:hypothetical protein
MRTFNPLRTDNVDNALDLMTYSLRVLTEFSENLRAHTILGQQEWESESAHLPAIPDELLCSSF